MSFDFSNNNVYRYLLRFSLTEPLTPQPNSSSNQVAATENETITNTQAIAEKVLHEQVDKE